MSEARIGRISNENSTAGPIISGITTFSGQNYFVPPKGTTAERPSNCPVGSIRFNTDSAKLEYFDGLQWLEMEAFNNELGVSGALGNRGLFGGGLSPSATNTIEYITISTLGNTTDFGDLTANFFGVSACSSSTRGLFAMGYNSSAGSFTNVIEFITISSTGNSTDFGDQITTANTRGSLSSATRGIFAGGRGPGGVNFNTIEYVTISATGNSVDFGDLVSGLERGPKGCSSSTRGLFAGAYSPFTNTIAYITISTLGNTVDFGDLTSVRGGVMTCSNATRGVFGGGYTPITVNTIDYVNIVSTGNAVTFGNLTVARQMNGGNGNCASPTRGIFAGGYNAPATVYNIIDYITILTTGNATDFGDLSTNRYTIGSCSNGHGGL